MDKFCLFKRKLKWDFASSTIPSDVSTEILASGVVTPNDLQSGGVLRLSCSNYSDQAVIDLPHFIPNSFDEIRVKALVVKSNEGITFNFGLFSDDLQNSVFLTRDSKATTVLNGASTTATPYTTWYTGTPTWFEIDWKPSEYARLFISERMVAKIDKSQLPDPSIAYRLRVLCKNTENPSTIEKHVDVYQAYMDLMAYSK